MPPFLAAGAPIKSSIELALLILVAGRDGGVATTPGGAGVPVTDGPGCDVGPLAAATPPPSGRTASFCKPDARPGDAVRLGGPDGIRTPGGPLLALTARLGGGPPAALAVREGGPLGGGGVAVGAGGAAPPPAFLSTQRCRSGS